MGSSKFPVFKHIILERKDFVFIVTLNRGPENRLTVDLCQEFIAALRYVQTTLGPDAPGALITKGNNAKFWCTGIELGERATNPFSNSEGFYPLVHAILDFPYPTIALLTGHTFGGACPLAMSHDYRVMNSERGFISMPPVNLGLQFDGMGSLLRLKLAPKTARKMLLEAHRWTGKEALADDIVDAIAPPNEMLDVATKFAYECAPRAAKGVFGVLRSELYGEAYRSFQAISYVRSRPTSRQPKVKI